jgi:hypothetical protein
VGYIGRFASRSWRRLSQSRAAASPQDPAATPTPPHRQLSNAAARAPRRRRDWSDSSRPATNLEARSTAAGGRSTEILAPTAVPPGRRGSLEQLKARRGAWTGLMKMGERGDTAPQDGAASGGVCRTGVVPCIPRRPRFVSTSCRWDPEFSLTRISLPSARLPSWNGTIITGYLFHVCVFGHIGGAFLYLLISFCRQPGTKGGVEIDRTWVGTWEK